MRRAEEPAMEALELSLSNGEDIALDLTESEELKLHGICGSHPRPGAPLPRPPRPPDPFP